MFHVPLRLVTVRPPQQAGQLLPWECCFFLSQELGWLEVSLGSCTKAEG